MTTRVYNYGEEKIGQLGERVRPAEGGGGGGQGEGQMGGGGGRRDKWGSGSNWGREEGV